MNFNTEENRDSWFKEQGFKRSEFFDKDMPTDAVDTLKFVEYNLLINDKIGIDVTYSYELINNGWQQVDANAYFDQIKMNVRTTDELKEAVEYLRRIFGEKTSEVANEDEL